MAPDLAAPWFSMTKIATATAAMALAERGELDLDAPVAPHRAGDASSGPRDQAERITARHLLQHSAGIANPIPVTGSIRSTSRGRIPSVPRRTSSASTRSCGSNPGRDPATPTSARCCWARRSRTSRAILPRRLGARGPDPGRDARNRLRVPRRRRRGDRLPPALEPDAGDAPRWVHGRTRRSLGRLPAVPAGRVGVRRPGRDRRRRGAIPPHAPVRRRARRRADHLGRSRGGDAGHPDAGQAVRPRARVVPPGGPARRRPAVRRAPRRRGRLLQRDAALPDGRRRRRRDGQRDEVRRRRGRGVGARHS